MFICPASQTTSTKYCRIQLFWKLPTRINEIVVSCRLRASVSCWLYYQMIWGHWAELHPILISGLANFRRPLRHTRYILEDRTNFHSSWTENWSNFRNCCRVIFIIKLMAFLWCNLFNEKFHDLLISSLFHRSDNLLNVFCINQRIVQAIVP